MMLDCTRVVLLFPILSTSLQPLSLTVSLYECQVCVCVCVCMCVCVHATISYPPALPAPTLTFIALPTVQAGASLTLNCSVSVVSNLASPPTILWTNISGQALPSDGSGLTHTLTFDPVRTSHAGVYRCIATLNIEEVGIVSRVISDKYQLFEVTGESIVRTWMKLVIYSLIIHTLTPSHHTQSLRPL